MMLPSISATISKNTCCICCNENTTVVVLYEEEKSLWEKIRGCCCWCSPCCRKEEDAEEIPDDRYVKVKADLLLAFLASTMGQAGANEVMRENGVDTADKSDDDHIMTAGAYRTIRAAQHNRALGSVIGAWSTLRTERRVHRRASVVDLFTAGNAPPVDIGCADQLEIFIFQLFESLGITPSKDAEEIASFLKAETARHGLSLTTEELLQQVEDVCSAETPRDLTHDQMIVYRSIFVLADHP